MDLLGSGRGLEQASDLLVALLLGSLGERGVLGRSAGLAADGGLRFSSVVPTSQVPKPSMFVVFSAVGISERTFMGDTPSRLTFSSVPS